MLVGGCWNSNSRAGFRKSQTRIKKYQAKTLSPVEEAYLQTIKDVEKTARKKQRKRGHKNGDGRCGEKITEQSSALAG